MGDGCDSKGNRQVQAPAIGCSSCEIWVVSHVRYVGRQIPFQMMWSLDTISEAPKYPQGMKWHVPYHVYASEKEITPLFICSYSVHDIPLVAVLPKDVTGICVFIIL